MLKNACTICCSWWLPLTIYQTSCAILTSGQALSSSTVESVVNKYTFKVAAIVLSTVTNFARMSVVLRKKHFLDPEASLLFSFFRIENSSLRYSNSACQWQMSCGLLLLFAFVQFWQIQAELREYKNRFAARLINTTELDSICVLSIFNYNLYCQGRMS